MSFWGPIIQGGLGIVSGMLDDEQKDEDNEVSRENLLLELQDNERDRENLLQLQASKSADDRYSADLGYKGTKKKIMGDVLLDQGDGQEKLGIEAFKSAANAPERFGTAANILAQILAR